MSKEEKRATWQRMVERAQADMAYYAGLGDGDTRFGRRFREARLAECETLLAVDAILREREPVVA